jgi:hypothetical protein
VAAQASARSVVNAEVLNRARIMQSALFEIMPWSVQRLPLHG